MSEKEENADLQKLWISSLACAPRTAAPGTASRPCRTCAPTCSKEAHELAGAIDGGDWEELAEELGDMLFQVAFIGRLAEEAGAFRLSQVIDGVHRKMVERHPHVFGGEALADAEAVRQAWERRKLQKEPKNGSRCSRASPPRCPPCSPPTG